MKAVRIHKFGSVETLKLEDVPKPEIEDDEVLIRVHAAGINPVDTYIREGSFSVLPPLPAILGREAAGVIENVGNTIDNFKEGDRVFVCLPENGGYAQYVKCKKNYVFPLADTLTFGQGAGLYIPYFTAYRALVTKCGVKPGEFLLVHGASGAVGIAAVQLAKALGLSVVGTAGTIEGMDLVKNLGADFVFNHKEKGYLNNAVAAIGGQGFNVVLENLANVNLGADLTVLNQQARVATKTGKQPLTAGSDCPVCSKMEWVPNSEDEHKIPPKFIRIGYIVESISDHQVVGSRGSVEVNPRSLMLTESTIVGVKLMGNTEEEHVEAAGAILKGIDDGWVQPIIAHEYSLEDAAQAHSDIIHNRGARGKLIFKL